MKTALKIVFGVVLGAAIGTAVIWCMVQLAWRIVQ